MYDCNILLIKGFIRLLTDLAVDSKSCFPVVPAILGKFALCNWKICCSEELEQLPFSLEDQNNEPRR